MSKNDSRAKKDKKGQKANPAPQATAKPAPTASAPAAAPQAQNTLVFQEPPLTVPNRRQPANLSLNVANNLFSPQIQANPNADHQPGKGAPLTPQSLANPDNPLITPDIGPDPRNSLCQVAFEQVPSQVAVDGIRFDFAYGYRVFVPNNAPRAKYEVRFFDMDSGMPLEHFELKPGQTLVGDRKFFIRYRMEILHQGELLFAHDYDCAGRRVHVVIPDGGLGDNLAWLPLVDLFQRQHKADVCCVMGEWMIRLAGDLYPDLSFVPSAGNPKLSGSYANYFCGIFKKENRSWRPIDHQFLGMQGAVEAILGLPQGPVKCRLHRGSKRPFPEPFVCISTMATNPGKGWNFPDGWNQIIRFLKSYGYRVLDLDRDPRLYFANKEYHIPEEAEDFTGRFPIQERINLLEHADFFIGLPSGLSWLAWNLDIPVLMLSGFTMPNCEFPTPYRVTNYLFCHGCWNDTDCFFDQMVPVWCPKHVGTPREIECTRAITPKMVRDTILRIPAFQRQMANMMERSGQGGQQNA